MDSVNYLILYLYFYKLQAVEQIKTDNTVFEFHHYAQSSKVQRSDDSSVSYAAGTLVSLWTFLRWTL